MRREDYRTATPLRRAPEGAVPPTHEEAREAGPGDAEAGGPSRLSAFRTAFEVNEAAQVAKTLDLSNQGWRDLSALAAQPGIAEVELLNLSGNPLGTIPASAFACCPQVKVVVLSNCSLESIDHRTFQGATEITDIDLSHNELSILPGWLLLPCAKLRSISLGHNPLETLPDNFFEDKPKLTGVSLAHTGCSEVPAELQRRLAQLYTVDLRGTGIRVFDFGAFTPNDDELHAKRSIRELPRIVWLSHSSPALPAERAGGHAQEEVVDGCYVFRENLLFPHTVSALLYSFFYQESTVVAQQVAADALQEGVAAHDDWKGKIERCLFRSDSDLFRHSGVKNILGTWSAGYGVAIVGAFLGLGIIPCVAAGWFAMDGAQRSGSFLRSFGIHRGEGVIKRGQRGLGGVSGATIDMSLLISQRPEVVWCTLHSIETDAGEDALRATITSLLEQLIAQLATGKRMPAIEGLVAGYALRFNLLDQLVTFFNHPLSAWSAVIGETVDGRMLYQAILDSHNPRVLHALWRSLVSITWQHERAGQQISLIKALLVPGVGINLHTMSADGIHLVRALADGDADPVLMQEVMRLLQGRDYVPSADEIKLISEGTGEARNAVMNELYRWLDAIAAADSGNSLYLLAKWALRRGMAGKLNTVTRHTAFDPRIVDAEGRTLLFEVANMPTASQGYIKAVAQILITSGCSLNHRDNEGRNARGFAQLKGQRFAEQVLLKTDPGLGAIKGVDDLIGQVRQWIQDIKDGEPDCVQTVMFEGPPGTGKTSVAKIAAKEMGCPFEEFGQSGALDIFVGGRSGRVSEVFLKARRKALEKSSPCVLLLDEMDSYCGDLAPGEGTSHTEVTSAFQTEIENIISEKAPVLIIGCTNYAENIKPAIASRFTETAVFNLPSEEARLQIVKELLAPVPHIMVTPELLNLLAEKTEGWSGRDLRNITRSAAALARRARSCLRNEHLEAAYAKEFTGWASKMAKKGLEIRCTPLVSRGPSGPGFRAVVGADPRVMREIVGIRDSLVDPGRFAASGYEVRGRILMHGLPGTGKTLYARALAEEADCKFFSTAGSTLQGMGVGAVRFIRNLFSTAATFRNAVIFIDEIDIITGGGCASGVREELQSQMDGFDQSSSHVKVLAATNHIEKMHGAVLRRFPTKLHFPPPGIEQRAALLASFLSKCRLLGERITAMGIRAYATEIADETEGLSPGDLKSMVMRAANIASFEGRGIPVSDEHIREALRAVHEDRIMAQTGSMGPPPGASRMPFAIPTAMPMPPQQSTAEIGRAIAAEILAALRAGNTG